MLLLSTMQRMTIVLPLLLACASCRTSHDVVTDAWLQQRKYRPGFYLNIKRPIDQASPREQDEVAKRTPLPRSRTSAPELLNNRVLHSIAVQRLPPSETSLAVMSLGQTSLPNVSINPHDVRVIRSFPPSAEDSLQTDGVRHFKGWNGAAEVFGILAVVTGIPSGIALPLSVVLLFLELFSGVAIPILFTLWPFALFGALAALLFALLSMGALYVAHRKGEQTSKFAENSGRMVFGGVRMLWAFAFFALFVYIYTVLAVALG